MISYDPDMLAREIRASSAKGLGDFKDTAGSATRLINSVTNLIPGSASGGISQTDTGKTAQTVKAVASVTGSLAAATTSVATALFSSGVAEAIPVVGAVAGLVVGAAVLVDKIWGSNKDKETMAKAGQVNQLNSVLRQQFTELNQKIKQVTDGLLQFNGVLKANGFNGIPAHLGSVADDTLISANTTNAQLHQAVAERTQLLQSLIENFNAAANQVVDAVSGKNRGEKIILWLLAGTAATGLLYFLYLKLQDKESLKAKKP